MTTVEQLAEINVAITAILGGAQEYSLGNRRVRRSELSVLLNERHRLEAQIASESGGDITVAYFDRR